MLILLEDVNHGTKTGGPLTWTGRAGSEGLTSWAPSQACPVTLPHQALVPYIHESTRIESQTRVRRCARGAYEGLGNAALSSSKGGESFE